MFRSPFALALLLGTAAAAQQPAAAPQAPPPAAAGQQSAGQGDGGLIVDVEGGISAPTPIAIPVMPAAAVVNTRAGSTDALGRQLSDIIANDLRNSGLFTPLSPGQLKSVSFPEVTQPAYDHWRGTQAQALVQGYIRANGGRDADRWLLSVRRFCPARIGAAGFRRAARRLAPCCAQNAPTRSIRG